MKDMKIYAFADEASALIDEQIVALRRNGLDGLEIRNVDGANVSDISLEKAAEVRRKLAAAGMSTWSIGSPMGKIRIGDDFEPHLEKFKHTLEIANVLGAKHMRMFSFYMPRGEDPETYKNQVIDRLAMFLETARGSGVRLCHENEKGIYGDTAERCLALHQALPELCGVFDPANFIQSDVDPLQAWALLREHVVYMHIKDARADGFVVPAGKGIGHVQQIVRAFVVQGGSCVTIEPHLAVFRGLSELEQGGQTSGIDAYCYPDADTAFDAACAAFRELLAE